jgi:hypothetical protein
MGKGSAASTTRSLIAMHKYILRSRKIENLLEIGKRYRTSKFDTLMLQVNEIVRPSK